MQEFNANSIEDYQSFHNKLDEAVQKPGLPAQAIPGFIGHMMQQYLPEQNYFADTGNAYAGKDYISDLFIFGYKKNSQSILVSKLDNDLSLFMDGYFQFSTSEIDYYHELLVLPAMEIACRNNRAKQLSVLVIGGGDGFCVDQLRKYDEVISDVTLVDIDPYMIAMAKHELLTPYNNNALNWNKVSIKIGDCLDYLQKPTAHRYDVIIVDLTDIIQHQAVVRFHTREMYAYIKQHWLHEHGVLSMQAGDILNEFSVAHCLVNTAQIAGFKTNVLQFPHGGDNQIINSSSCLICTNGECDMESLVISTHYKTQAFDSVSDMNTPQTRFTKMDAVNSFDSLIIRELYGDSQMHNNEYIYEKMGNTLGHELFIKFLRCPNLRVYN